MDIIGDIADTLRVQIETLKSYLKARGIHQSLLARKAGVTRQAVSNWFSKSGFIDLRASTLQKVASALGVRIEDLCHPLPILGNAQERKKWETDLLWDRLYPDLETFISALHRGQRQALGRLVQAVGLYQAEKIAGKKVLNKFQSYKGYIHPAYRQQAEILWKTKMSPIPD